MVWAWIALVLLAAPRMSAEGLIDVVGEDGSALWRPLRCDADGGASLRGLGKPLSAFLDRESRHEPSRDDAPCFRAVVDDAVPAVGVAEMLVAVHARCELDSNGFARVAIEPDDPVFRRALAAARDALELRVGRPLCALAANARVVSISAPAAPERSALQAFGAGEWDAHGADDRRAPHAGFPWHADQYRDPLWRYTSIAYLSSHKTAVAAAGAVSEEERGAACSREEDEERCVGGETAFADAVRDDASLAAGSIVAPRGARLLLFSAGRENTHRALPTYEGRRVILQTQWAFHTPRENHPDDDRHDHDEPSFACKAAATDETRRRSRPPPRDIPGFS